MIRRYPDVPAAVELADLARHIVNAETVLPDPVYNFAWVWQSNTDLQPNLRIIVPLEASCMKRGRLVVRRAVMVLIEPSAEYELSIPVVGAPHIDDDPYIEDFVSAFRQYDADDSFGQVIIENEHLLK